MSGLGIFDTEVRVFPPPKTIRFGTVVDTELTQKMEIAGLTARVVREQAGHVRFYVVHESGMTEGPYTLKSEMVQS